jgi:hypothetical protein
MVVLFGSMAPLSTPFPERTNDPHYHIFDSPGVGVAMYTPVDLAIAIIFLAYVIVSMINAVAAPNLMMDEALQTLAEVVRVHLKRGAQA